MRRKTLIFEEEDRPDSLKRLLGTVFLLCGVIRSR